MKRTKIALIGANGQLGSDLVKILRQDSNIHLYPLVHSDIDITNEPMVRTVLDDIKPDIVINTAAYHRVDDCETSIDKAFLVNAIAQKKLAGYCSQQNQTLIYISTDYVFGLNKERKTPYKETDVPGPLNTYAISKLAGEYFTRYICQKHFVIRSSGLFGAAGSSVKGGNFVENILKLAREKGRVRVVNDQVITPTYTVDLAKQIHTLIKTENYGLYHATAQGACSWYTFAKEIFRLTKTRVTLNSVTTAEFPTPAKRPAYSVLANANLKNLNLYVMPDWRMGLKNYLIEKGHVKD